MQFDPTRRAALKLSGGTLLATAAAMTPSALAAPTSNSSSQGLLNVKNFGATGDGKTLDTAAIQRAMDAAAAAGGGTVYLPAGMYLSFSLRLKSNVHLYLDAGCVLIAADSPLPGQTTGYMGGVYDAAEPNAPWEDYQDYGHNHWHNSLLWAEEAHNMSITGSGMIWGRGLSHGRGSEKQGYNFVAEQAGVGNKSIAMKNCRNVLFRDFAVLKGGHFCFLMTGVDNLTVDNITMDTDRDGIDIDCCRNVRVSNCTVNSPWDDGICPKSSYALGYARSTENVTITNCYVTGTYELGRLLDGTFKKFPEGVRTWKTGRIKCGTESNGGFKNITISNCVFEGCQGLALESEDGALMEDVTVTNITMRDIVSCPIFLRLGARLRGPKQTTQVGVMRRILISNVTSSNCNAKLSSILSGVPGHAIEDVKLSNIYVENKGGGTAEMAAITPPEKEDAYPDPHMFGTMPACGFYFRHVKRLEASHIEVATQQPDQRPAFYLHDVERADFLCATAPTNVASFHTRDVRDFRVLLSRAMKDTILSNA